MFCSRIVRNSLVFGMCQLASKMRRLLSSSLHVQRSGYSSPREDPACSGSDTGSATKRLAALTHLSFSHSTDTREGAASDMAAVLTEPRANVQALKCWADRRKRTALARVLQRTAQWFR